MQSPYKKMMTQDILQIRRQKLKNEIETARRIQKRGIHPLDVLDDLISNMSDLMRIGLLEKKPNATEEQILKMMRNLVKLNKKVRKKRENW
jgi:hypothetical protein